MYWFDNALQTESGVVCLRHRVLFVATGCPVCVGLMRAEVRKLVTCCVENGSGFRKERSPDHAERIKAGLAKRRGEYKCEVEHDRERGGSP